MLRMHAVNQSYGPKQILRDIHLELPYGQCTCLLGRNGVGKTTLINCIMGHVPVSSGSVTWQLRGEEAQDLLAHPAEARASLGIGYVPQGRQIFSQLSVEENLHVALLAGRNHNRQVPEMVHNLFPFLFARRRARAGELTAGQQQQLAIARALMPKPELLILDEPTAGLLPAAAQEFGHILRRMQHEFGLTLLLVEQQLPLGVLTGDRYYLLEGGRNVAQGLLDEQDNALIQGYLAS